MRQIKNIVVPVDFAGHTQKIVDFAVSVADTFSATLHFLHIAKQILSFARRENSDMIVMGTHGTKGIEEILLGSVARRVVARAPCPVLTFNPYKGPAPA